MSKCEKCGSTMIEYYGSHCFKCEIPTPDKKGRYMLIPVCYYIALKNGFNYKAIWKSIADADFVEGNDRICDLYFSYEDMENMDDNELELENYLKLIDDEFPLQTTNFYVSW